MASNQALQIVDRVVANHASFKFAARDLEALAPDRSAVEALIGAWRSGTAPPWLVAHLLGCIGHDAGYAATREILLSAPGSLAESYAGVALAKIRGAGARADLAALLRMRPARAAAKERPTGCSFSEDQRRLTPSRRLVSTVASVRARPARSWLLSRFQASSWSSFSELAGNEASWSCSGCSRPATVLRNGLLTAGVGERCETSSSPFKARSSATLRVSQWLGRHGGVQR